MHKLTTVTLSFLVLIDGCATSTGSDGIVEIGPDTYRVASHGRYKDFTSSALKARLYQDAYRHCAAKNKLMVPAENQNSASGAQSSDMQFQCVTRNQAGAPAPTL